MRADAVPPQRRLRHRPAHRQLRGPRRDRRVDRRRHDLSRTSASPSSCRRCSTTRRTTRSSARAPARRARHKLLRVPAKWLIRKIAERLSNSAIPDLNSGLRAFRRSVSLPYLRLLPPGFSCVTTITLAFLSNQHDIRYVPIDYAKRSGTSKFHFIKDAYRYILQVLRMVMYFNPLKVLMPLALWLLAIGLAKGCYDLVAHFGAVRGQHRAHLHHRHAHRGARAARGPHRPVPLRDLTRDPGDRPVTPDAPEDSRAPYVVAPHAGVRRARRGDGGCLRLGSARAVGRHRRPAAPAALVRGAPAHSGSRSRACS